MVACLKLMQSAKVSTVKLLNLVQKGVAKGGEDVTLQDEDDLDTLLRKVDEGDFSGGSQG